MERTVKWIRNFLIGKPTNGSGTIEFGAQNLPPINPNATRRWSFKRSTNRETGHKLTRSVDSIDVARLGVHLPELQSRDRRSVRVVRGDSHSAAIMIQSVFRSYLARKALRALRGLVKLQAVVRGYLVRKQSRASLRCFHSLISIQSRARLHRIQMAKKTEIGFNRRKSSSYRNPNKETNDHDFNRASKSKSSHFDFPTVARIEHGLTAYYSGDISDSNRNGYIPFDVPDFVPHYMANTKSSTAKNTRSQSEPRQRPKGRPRQKSTETRPKHFGSSPNAGFDGRDPWFLKLYKGRRMDTTESESTSSGTSKSNYSRSLFLYEPPLTMY